MRRSACDWERGGMGPGCEASPERVFDRVARECKVDRLRDFSRRCFVKVEGLVCELSKGSEVRTSRGGVRSQELQPRGA